MNEAVPTRDTPFLQKRCGDTRGVPHQSPDPTGFLAAACNRNTLHDTVHGVIRQRPSGPV